MTRHYDPFEAKSYIKTQVGFYFNNKEQMLFNFLVFLTLKYKTLEGWRDKQELDGVEIQTLTYFLCFYG